MKHCKTCQCEEIPLHLRITERDREVLRLMVAGYTMKEIGAELGIAGRTVKAHNGKLYRLFGITTGCRRIKLIKRCFEDSRILRPDTAEPPSSPVKDSPTGKSRKN